MTSLTLASVWPSYQASLEASGLSPNTIRVYRHGVLGLDGYVGMFPQVGIEEITPEMVGGFIISLRDNAMSEATINTRYKSLRTFFLWLVREEEIEKSPLANIKEPTVTPPETPVLSITELRRLMDTCKPLAQGMNRRDRALLRMLIDTGMRNGECAGIKVEDIRYGQKVIRVMGKGRLERFVPLGRMVEKDVLSWLRHRPEVSEHHPAYGFLWSGTRNGMVNERYIHKMVAQRGAEAGILGLHPHVLRHTFAHNWLAEGGAELDLIRICGWSSTKELNRYGAVLAQSRAQAAHKEYSIGDRI